MTDMQRLPRKRHRIRRTSRYFTWRNILRLKRALSVAGVILIAVSIGLLAWERQPKPPTLGDHVHYGWFRHSFVADLLMPWYENAVTANGFMQARLDRQWHPRAPYTATLVSQSRLIYVMAIGYEVTDEAHYQDAVLRGGDFLLEHFRDPQSQHWYSEVDRTGKVINNARDEYGEAFVVFALARAFRVTQQERFRAAALATWQHGNWEALTYARMLAHGGAAKVNAPSGTHNHNTMLHLFEALLALHEVTGNEAVWDDIEALAAFLEQRLYQPDSGQLPWYFDADWHPLPAAKGGMISLGHQVEWAYFLSQAVAHGLSTHYLTLARKLLDNALALGYDRVHGGLYESANYDGTIDSHGKEIWQQAELLRALMHFAVVHDRPDLWPKFSQTLALLKSHYMDGESGGWVRLPDAAASHDPRAADKGDIWFCGYHLTNFYREALNLHARAGVTWRAGEAR